MSDVAAARPRPGVFRTAAHAWASTWAALRAMPLTFLVTLAAYALVRLASSYAAGLQAQAAAEGGYPPADGPSGAETAAALLVMSLYVVRVFALVPLAIAIHRFVLLGERSPLLPLTPARRVLRFGGWLIVLGLLNSLSGLLNPRFGAALLPALGELAIEVVAIFVGIRLVLVFPAVAVQTDTKPLALSWRATNWQFWRIIGVLLVTFLPMGMATGLILWLAAYFDAATSQEVAGWRVLGATLDVLYVALGAAAASWLFLGYGLRADTRAAR